MNKSEQLIACLEGEVAKRDARIVELEQQVIGMRLDVITQVDAHAVTRAELAAIKVQGVVMPEGWIPLTIEHEPGYPEDVAFGPKRMMDRLKKWLDRYFEMRLNAAPVQQVSVPDGWRLVPVEPTEAMRKAAQDKLASEGLIVTDWLIHTAYSAMLAAAPAAPAADAGDVLEQAMYTLISIGYHENSGLVHELRQALAAHSAKGVV